MSTKNNKESFELNFLGFKLKSENPGPKTILTVVIILAFLAIMIWELKVYVLPGIATTQSKTVISAVSKKVSGIFRLTKKGGP